jgi:hypothetical protein
MPVARHGRSCHFAMPPDELLLEILLIVEPSHFEEEGFYETHQVLNGTLLLRAMGPTQLHPDAQLEHDDSQNFPVNQKEL